MSILNQSTKYSTILVNAVITFSAIFAVYQYLDHIQSSRIDRTLEFIRDFQSGPTYDAQRRISDVLWKYSDEIDTLNRTPISATDADEMKKSVSTFLAVDADGGLKLELNEIVSFFSTLGVCLRQDICDLEVARSFFSEYLEDFWANFGPYILIVRITIPEYGIDIEHNLGRIGL